MATRKKTQKGDEPTAKPKESNGAALADHVRKIKPGRLFMTQKGLDDLVARLEAKPAE